MEIVVKALYNASFTIWNTLMGLAMTLFSTSPTSAAGGSPYGTVHSLYNSISVATIPIATCFFVIAIYKSVVTSPLEQQAQKDIAEAVAWYNEQRNDPDYYYLPDRLDGKNVQWESPADTSGMLLTGLFLIAAMVILVMKGREEQVQLQKRYEELLMDYPGLIMKFTLLVQTGMTVRKAFQKISLDYSRKKKQKSRPAYDEVRIICYEMESGVSESEAYRRFGERCGQSKYKTFATLLIQNLQKGSRQMADMLERESMEAWEERKRKARVLGEAAATKLLIPMIMMLLVVMAIVMIPAFLAFYGGT